jgi:hypothetical protein
VNEYLLSFSHQGIINLSLDPEGQIVFEECQSGSFNLDKVALDNLSDFKCLIGFETKHTPKELVEVYGFSLDPKFYHPNEENLERTNPKPSWIDRETFTVILAKGTKTIIAVRKNRISE